MGDGSSWYSWFSFPFFAPWSGAVTQQIAPAVYAGVPEIEADVVQHVASYGTQLGILSEALVELANRGKHDLIAEVGDMSEGPAVTRLRELVGKVEQVKERHREAALRSAEQALDRLREIDWQAHKQLVAKVRVGPG